MTRELVKRQATSTLAAPSESLVPSSRHAESRISPKSRKLIEEKRAILLEVSANIDVLAKRIEKLSKQLSFIRIFVDLKDCRQALTTLRKREAELQRSITVTLEDELADVPGVDIFEKLRFLETGIPSVPYNEEGN